MGIPQPKVWITGGEFGEERRRLLLAGLTDESPELQQLWSLVRERDGFLWEKYARPLIETHRGHWAAVGLNGEIVLGETASEVIHTATQQFGTANFAYGRLTEFRGHRLRQC